MKSIVITIALLLAVSGLSAQRYFYYIQYNQYMGNASAIVQFIDDVIVDGAEQIVVYMSNTQSPLLAQDEDQWKQMREQLLTLQITPDVNEQYDEQRLNTLFTDIFDETVTDQLNLRGRNDEQWTCRFVLPPDSREWDLTSTVVPYEVVEINQLTTRMNVEYYYHSSEFNELQKIK